MYRVSHFKSDAGRLSAPSLKTWAMCLSLALMVGTGLFLAYKCIISVYYFGYGVLNDYADLSTFSDMLVSIFNGISVAMVGFWAVSVIHETEENFLELKPLIFAIGLCLIIAFGLTLIKSEYYDGYMLSNLGLLSFVFYRLQRDSKWLKFVVLLILISSVLSLGLSSITDPAGGYTWPKPRVDIEIALHAFKSIWAISMLFKTPAWVRLLIATLLSCALIFYVFIALPANLTEYFEIIDLYSLITGFLYAVPYYVFMLMCLYRPSILRSQTIETL